MIEEWPYCCVVSKKYLSAYCSFCFKLQSNLQRCSRCKFVYYCSAACQKSGWIDHKDECYCLENVRPKIPPDVAQFMARIIFKKRAAAAENNISCTVSEESGRKFDDLMNHVNEIAVDPLREEHFAQLCLVLKHYIGAEMLPEVAELHSIFGKIMINSYSMLNFDLNPIGTGIYLTLSAIDHSCNPNAVVTFEGAKAVLRPLQKGFCLDDLTQVYISYVELLATTKERQEQLKEQYYFTCQCEVCTNKELDAQRLGIKCKNANCEGAVCATNEEFFSCLVCGQTVSTSKWDEAQDMIQETKWELDRLEDWRKVGNYSDIVNRCKTVLMKQTDLLHRCNIMKIRTLDKAMDACMELEQWKMALSFGLDSLHGYTKWYPAHYPNIILLKVKLGKLMVFLERLEPAARLLTEALESSEISYGKTAVFYEEISKILSNCEEEKRIKLHQKQLLNDCS